MSISEESFDLLKMDRDIQRRARISGLLRAGLWTALLAFGARRRGVLGFAAMAVSLERLYRVLEPGARQCWNALPRRRRMGSGGELQSDWDSVDQGLWETFPASDPPHHMVP